MDNKAAIKDGVGTKRELRSSKNKNKNNIHVDDSFGTGLNSEEFIKTWNDDESVNDEISNDMKEQLPDKKEQLPDNVGLTKSDVLHMMKTVIPQLAFVNASTSNESTKERKKESKVILFNYISNLVGMIVCLWYSEY